MLLENKVVIITGVGPGMGGKLAVLAAREGAKVVLAARSTEFVEGVVKEIRAFDGKAISVRADVSLPADCHRIAAKAIAAFGRIDCLVNSAYRAGKMVSFEDADLNDWKDSFEVTFFGALYMSKAVLPAMKANGGGSIVNVGTMETRKPLLNNGAYNVPKSALQAATRQLAAELGKYQIRVNSAVIGWMWGKSVEEYMTRYAEESGIPLDTIIAERASHFPLGRIPPDEECAKPILVLLSDYCSQVTGAAWDINGGELFSQ